MTLKEMLNSIGNSIPIRIFAGCMTIFHGKKSDISEKEWNLKVHPYMECEVVNSCAINGVIVLAI